MQIAPRAFAQSQSNSAAKVTLSLSPAPIIVTDETLPSSIALTPVSLSREQVSLPPLRPIELIEKLANIVDSVIKVIAVVAAAFFAYWKFLRGRLFHARLETSISLKPRTESNKVFLTVSCKLKNVGLSKVDLDKEHSAIRLFFHTPQTNERVVRWPQDAALAVDVFASHEWIESGETIQDSNVFIFDDVPGRLYRAELKVVRKRYSVCERLKEWNRRRRGPNSWTQHALVTGENGSSTKEANPNKI